jgi:hypothetical protein
MRFLQRGSAPHRPCAAGRRRRSRSARRVGRVRRECAGPIATGEGTYGQPCASAWRAPEDRRAIVTEPRRRPRAAGRGRRSRSANARWIAAEGLHGDRNQPLRFVDSRVPRPGAHQKIRSAIVRSSGGSRATGWRRRSRCTMRVGCARRDCAASFASAPAAVLDRRMWSPVAPPIPVCCGTESDGERRGHITV